MNHNKNKVKEKILNFESALNLGNIEDVLSFYSDEAIFMPDGNKALKKGQIGKSGAEFFIESDFKIRFENVKIATDESYAFVDAIAKASQNDKNSSKLEKTSRDLFVFRKEEGDWKIFRYIFNNNVVTSKL